MPPPASSNGIYRTPGRAPDPPQVPLAASRMLLAPVISATGVVLVIALPVVVFGAIRALVLGASADTRFVPAVDLALDLLALALLASPVWLGLMIAGRVAPYWNALGPWGKAGYVAALFSLELLVLATAQAWIATSRTGRELFGPTLQRTSRAPDGRRAHVYRGGLVECRYDVYVASPLAVTMTRELTVAPCVCTTPTPHVRWRSDRTIQLVDDAGRVLEPDALIMPRR